jgi:murein L,D-transpeptidase YafK
VKVLKAERVLALYSGETVVKEYPVGLGSSPERDKEREGDGRTPLGEFYVCTRLERSRFHRFIGLSYPAPEDAARGLREAMITRAEAAEILSAHRRRVKPPWDTPLGGAIGIHGGGSGLDWTRGCIALENRAAEELFQALPMGTPVRVRE